MGGGIPIIRTLIDSMQANNVRARDGHHQRHDQLYPHQDAEEGRAFDEVLQEAQRLGYAEANPTADVEGYDAMYKLSILSSLAFHAHMPIDAIYREGITKLTAEDFEAAGAARLRD